jgi:hypothetical protein
MKRRMRKRKRKKWMRMRKTMMRITKTRTVAMMIIFAEEKVAWTMLNGDGMDDWFDVDIDRFARVINVVMVA